MPAASQQAYDDFISGAQQYGNGTMWELATEGHTAGQYDRRELKRKLYRAVANVNILEGIRFYVSFACSFAFGELKLMEGIRKDHLPYCKRREPTPCHHPKHSEQMGSRVMILR